MYRKLLCSNGHDLTKTTSYRYSVRDGQRVQCYTCKLLSHKKWYTKAKLTNDYLVKRRVRRYTQTLVQSGRLIKLNLCIMCGYSGRTELHHTSYTKDPSFKNIIEVCRLCHIIIEKDIIQSKVKVVNHG